METHILGRYMRGYLSTIAGVAVVFLIAILSMAYTISSQNATIKTMEGDVKSLTSQRDTLLEDKKTAEAEVKLLKEQAVDLQATLTKRSETISGLEKRLSDIVASLPKPKPKKDESPTSKEDDTRSAARIVAIWKLYCSHPSTVNAASCKGVTP